jgi:hypothetical protein
MVAASIADLAFDNFSCMDSSAGRVHPSSKGKRMTEQTRPLDELLAFPLMEAIFGRRSRRFGLGMSIPSGPLAFTSNYKPHPLSELEQSILVAAATGVTGFNFGIPFTSHRPTEFAHYTERFTGRAAPVNAAIGSPMLFYTDDEGIYLTDVRDFQPTGNSEYEKTDAATRILDVCRRNTLKLGEARLDLPREPPHVLEHNLWVGNAPGSTLFMPVSDTSETFIQMLAIFVGSGYWVFDDTAKKPAGELDRFYKSGLLNEAKPVPLSFVEQGLLTSGAAELAMMCQNTVLTMQAMGLGGWFYSGLNPYSVLGASADQGIKGLGFRFRHDERWSLPDPVGLDGHFETLGPPYQATMREAVQVFADRKFGSGGAFDPKRAGPFLDSPDVKRSVTPYNEEFLDCISTMAQYLHDTYGKFPTIAPRSLLAGYVQAQHIDTEFYDRYYQSGAYLETHAEHMKTWHSDK